MLSVKNETKLRTDQGRSEGAGAVWVVDACGLTVKGDSGSSPGCSRSRCFHEGLQEHPMHIALKLTLSCSRSTTFCGGPSASAFAGDDVSCCR